MKLCFKTPISYKNKTKMSGKPGLIIKSSKLNQIYTSYLSLLFGGIIQRTLVIGIINFTMI